MRKSKKLAFAAILSALSVVLLYLGSAVTVFDLTAVAFASLLIMVAVMEEGGVYPYLIWLVSGVLSVMLLPDKFGAIVYLCFGGIYPILKAYYERLHPVLAWIVKVSTFNTMLLFMILMGKYIIGVKDDVLSFALPLILLCNFTFVIYDVATTHLATLYLVKFRKVLGIRRFLR